MLKKIIDIPQTNNAFLISKYNVKFLFIFGWVGYIKYKFKSKIHVDVKDRFIKLLGRGSLFFTYLELIKKLYYLTSFKSKQSITIVGVGFKFRLLSNMLYIILGYSHVLKLKIYNNLNVVLSNNKSLEIHSLHIPLLNEFVDSLNRLKKIDVYKNKGIHIKGYKYLKKEGKQSKF